MKLRIFSLLVLLLPLLSTSSCFITSHDYEIEITCENFNESNHCISAFNMTVGDKVRVRLCSNSTAGFQWEYQMTQGNIVKQEDHDYEEPENSLMGTAGVEIWTFEAIASGTTEVQMEYNQLWEGGEEEVWTYNMTITVN
jgi:predicted secreted protein